jgi:hypothetical protein
VIRGLVICGFVICGFVICGFVIRGFVIRGFVICGFVICGFVYLLRNGLKPIAMDRLLIFILYFPLRLVAKCVHSSPFIIKSYTSPSANIPFTAMLQSQKQ